MKHTMMIILGCAVLFAACGNAQEDGSAAGDSAEVLQSASWSQFPTVSKDAYAPWAKMQDEAFSAVHPEDAPKASDIDIPPFPDSFIISSGTLGAGNTAMRFVILICADAREAVQDYYARELVDGRGWTYADQYGVFQPGTGNDFIVESTPFVSITALNPQAEEMRFVDKEFAANFVTRIQVTYR
ncbi:MAG: hypothetical protein RRA94_01040 [Bacteroidota bacterium]|nr:hypothetical protein [Bacteroidota bacterium]